MLLTFVAPFARRVKPWFPIGRYHWKLLIPVKSTTFFSATNRVREILWFWLQLRFTLSLQADEKRNALSKKLMTSPIFSNFSLGSGPYSLAFKEGSGRDPSILNCVYRSRISRFIILSSLLENRISQVRRKGPHGAVGKQQIFPMMRLSSASRAHEVLWNEVRKGADEGREFPALYRRSKREVQS